MNSDYLYESLFYDEARCRANRLGFFTVTMADNMCFGIASYNMHGVNNGHSGLLELFNNTSIHIIAVQEHWLHDGNLHVLNNVHPDFVGFCILSMSDRLHTSVYRGRPYDGGFSGEKNTFT